MPGLRFAAERDPFRRQAGGNIFSAFDLVGVPVLIHLFLGHWFVHHLGASLHGFPVRMLLRMTQAAAGAESHASSPAAGKISFTHSLIGLSIYVDILQMPIAINELSTEDPP